MNRWLVAGTAVAVLVVAAWITVGTSTGGEENAALRENVAELAQPAAPGNSPPSDPVKRGQEVFENHCAACHSREAGEVIVGPSLKGFFTGVPAPLADGRVLPQTDAAVREMIKNGTSYMPPMASDLNEQQIEDVIAYLRTL